MKFQIFVFALLFDLNYCGTTKGPHNQLGNVTSNQQKLPVSIFSSIERNTSAREGHVEVLSTPHKLENDKNLYRVIRLTNGLKALLISTQEYGLTGTNTAEYLKSHPKKSACNLNVDVGSFSNPRAAQGLGHLIGKFGVFPHRFYFVFPDQYCSYIWYKF